MKSRKAHQSARTRVFALFLTTSFISTAVFAAGSSATLLGRLLPASADEAAPGLAAGPVFAAASPLSLAAPVRQEESPAFVTTDRTDYNPGETVVITGSSFLPREVVTLSIKREGVDVAAHQATADENGNIYNNEFVIGPDDHGASFELTARGTASGKVASARFTDGTMSYTPATQQYTGSGAVQVNGAGSASKTFTQTVRSPSDNPKNFDASLQVVPNSVTFNGNPTVQFPASFTVTTSPSLLSYSELNQDKSWNVTITVPGTTPVGVYTALIRALPSNSSHNAGAGTQVILEVKSATPADTTAPTTTVNSGGYVNNSWTNQNVTVTLNATDNAGGSGVKNITYKINNGSNVVTAGSSVTVPAFTAQGDYTITYFATDNANNSESPANTFRVKIDKTIPVITLNGEADVTVTYGSGPYSDPGATAADSGGSGLNGAVSVAGSVNTNVVADYTLTYNVSDNAGNAAAPLTRAVRVVKAEQTILFGALADKTYGDPDFEVSATAGSGDPVVFSASGDCTVNGATVHITGAGSCSITANEDGSPNYNAAPPVSQSFSIARRPVAATADAKTKTYGETDPALTYQVTSGSLVGADAFSGVLTRAAGENVGAYAIQQGTLALSNNYLLTFVGNSLTITKRAVTVTADARSKTYGDADPQLTYQITSGSLAGSDAFAGGLARDAGENVGQYAIRQGALALGANYELTFVPANLTINRRAVSVKADDKSKTYGEADPALTFQITGGSLVNGDGFTGSLTRAPGEGVNTYEIGQGTLALSNNYELTFQGGVLTINRRAVTVAADAKSKTYGEADPPLTYRITSGSLVGADAFSGALSRAAGENVGTYAIRQGTLTLNNNYSLTYVGADLTINKRPVTVTAAAQSKTYGDPDPALAYEVTSGNLIAGDAFSGALTRDAGESVGAYPIRQGTLTLGGNYELTFVGASLTINKKAASVTPDPAGKTYGDADPALTGALSGFLAGDGVSATYSRAAGETVGDYTISAALGPAGVLANYEIAYNTAQFTISRRALVVTPADKTKTYGDAFTAFTGSVTGVVNGDGVTASYQSAGAAAGAAAGDYSITASLNDPNNKLGNYAPTLNTGTLTVVKALLTVTADNKQKIQGGQNPPLTATITGFKNNETLATSGVTGQPALSTTADVNSPPAVYPITSAAGTLAATNYYFAFVNGALTVTPNQAPVIQTVSANVDPVQLGSVATVNATFTDADVPESGPYTAIVDWGDGVTTTQTSAEPLTVTAPPLAPAGATGSVSGSHQYAAAGVYTITVTVSDKIPGADTEVYKYVVVYDPNGGFVTGGGWIWSPAGAYAADPSLTGKANFGFNSKYKAGQSVPTGDTEFQFQAGNLKFKSRSYYWMVISGTTKAQYKGQGTINGSGDYEFLLTSTDGDNFQVKKPDTFRIKIWERATGNVVYDNQVGAGDDAEPTTVLGDNGRGGGNITIHRR